MAAAIRLSQQHSCSLDHLIGAGQQRRGQGNAKGCGRKHVHDEIEFGRLLDRNVARLRPTQNLVDIIGGAPKQIRVVWSEGHQAIAAFHSITSSARASSIGDTSSLSSLAICRLMTSSNLAAN